MRSALRKAAGGLLVVSAIALGAGHAKATDPAPSPEQVTERTRGLLAVWSALQSNVGRLRVDLEESLVSAGEFAGARARWLRSGIATEGGGPITDRISVGFAPSFAYESLRFDGSDRFRTSELGRRFSRFDDFVNASLNVGSSYRLDHGLGLEFVASANLRQEVGAAFDESLRVGGSVAGTYRRGSWLRLRLGIGMGSDLGDRRFRVSPVYRVVIRPREGLSLEASGLEGGISWDALPGLQLGVSGGVDSTQYRLDRRRGPPGGLGSGTLQRRQANLRFESVTRYWEWLRIRTMIGMSLEQELSVLDEDGKQLDRRRERDPALIAGIRFELNR